MKHPRDWDLRWFNADFGMRWGLPIVVLALGVGALVGAIDYRFDVPVVTTQGASTTVTQTSSAPPSTLPAETRVVRATVTQTVEKPAPAVQAATVTKTVTPAPETVAVERRKKDEKETTTVTVTQPAQGLFNAELERGRRNGSDN